MSTLKADVSYCIRGAVLLFQRSIFLPRWRLKAENRTLMPAVQDHRVRLTNIPGELDQNHVPSQDLPHFYLSYSLNVTP